METSLERYQKSPKLFNFLGVGRQKLGNHSAANEAFNQALLLDPDFASAHFNLANSQSETGEKKAAIDSYRRAALLNPRHIVALRNLAILLLEENKIDDAIAQLHAALSVDPNYADAIHTLGNAYFMKQEFSSSIHCYEQALTQKVNEPSVRYYLGLAYLNTGHYNLAIENIREANRISPNNERYLVALLSIEISNAHLVQGKSSLIEDVHKCLKSMKNSDPTFLIYSAILMFVSKHFSKSNEYINFISAIDDSQFASMKTKDKQFCFGYYNFFKALLQSKDFTKSKITYSNKIYHIGDSHCLSFAHDIFHGNGETYEIVPLLTFGAKTFHIGNEEQNKFKTITKNSFQKIPRESIVFLSFGEIDCRPHEAFLKAAKKLDQSLQLLVGDTVCAFVTWLTDLNKTTQHTLYFFNVPAPCYNQNLTGALNNSLKNLIKLYNEALHYHVDRAGYQIVDVYSATANDMGFSNEIYHLDGVHLNTDVIEKVVNFNLLK